MKGSFYRFVAHQPEPASDGLPDFARTRPRSDAVGAPSEPRHSLKDAHGRDTVILVTSAYHMRRSLLLFTRAGVSVVPFPVDFQTSTDAATIVDYLPSGGSMKCTETAMRELCGYLFYRLIKAS